MRSYSNSSLNLPENIDLSPDFSYIDNIKNSVIDLLQDSDGKNLEKDLDKQLRLDFLLTKMECYLLNIFLNSVRSNEGIRLLVGPPDIQEEGLYIEIIMYFYFIYQVRSTFLMLDITIDQKRLEQYMRISFEQEINDEELVDYSKYHGDTDYLNLLSNYFFTKIEGFLGKFEISSAKKTSNTFFQYDYFQKDSFFKKIKEIQKNKINLLTSYSKIAEVSKFFDWMRKNVWNYSFFIDGLRRSGEIRAIILNIYEFYFERKDLGEAFEALLRRYEECKFERSKELHFLIQDFYEELLKIRENMQDNHEKIIQMLAFQGVDKKRVGNASHLIEEQVFNFITSQNMLRSINHAIDEVLANSIQYQLLERECKEEITWRRHDEDYDKENSEGEDEEANLSENEKIKLLDLIKSYKKMGTLFPKSEAKETIEEHDIENYSEEDESSFSGEITSVEDEAINLTEDEKIKLLDLIKSYNKKEGVFSKREEDEDAEYSSSTESNLSNSSERFQL